MIPFKWNEQQKTLIIKQQGGYAGALKKLVLNIVGINEQGVYGIDITPKAKTVVYAGEKSSVE
ncbi:MAG: hypothetical protein ABJB11_20730 [Ferruginibacter sp.]